MDNTTPSRPASTRTLRGYVCLLMLLLLGSPSAVQAQDPPAEPAAAPATEEAPAAGGDQAAGEKLFKQYCSSCHKVYEDYTGPALTGVRNRHSFEWIVKWVHGPQAMIDSGDPEAVALYEKWKTSGVMNAFPTLSEGDIENILTYIDNAPQPQEATTVTTDGVETTTDAGASQGLTLLLAVVLIVLLLVLLVLVFMAAILYRSLKKRDDLDDDDKEYVSQTHKLLPVLKHPAFIGIVGTIVLVAGFLWLLKGVLYEIGVQQGYQPTQPIAFSHVIHAGEHEIECVYCHTSVYESKNANVPSVNICMNCHSAIKTESKEIQKIWAYADWDAETRTMGPNAKPIEWVRIHNLPDLAYFNHSQHTQVAGVECETCHGQIAEMEVVYQYSPLTMAWCINCHRETEVNTKDNAYYDQLVKWHEENRGEENLTVEQIGGLECSRCHY